MYLYEEAVVGDAIDNRKSFSKSLLHGIDNRIFRELENLIPQLEFEHFPWHLNHPIALGLYCFI